MFFARLFVGLSGHTKTKTILRGLNAFSGALHWRFAFLIWIILQLKAPYIINPIPMLIGSLFPDTDHKNAPIGMILPLWLFFNHRGFTHSLVGLVVFTAPILYYNWKWGVLFAAGYMLHLCMDGCTPMGIKWFMGHKRKKRR